MEEKARELLRAAEAERASPGAAAERRDSADAFSALDGAGALRAVRAELPEVLDADRQPRVRLRQGEQLARRAGQYAAVIGRSSGKRGLAVSGAPLMARDDKGELVPVDHRLVDGGGFWEPAQAAEAVRLPKRLGDGAALPGAGVGVRVAGADGSVAGSAEGGDKAFYANAAVDTDVALGPVSRGLEAWWVLRSEMSPEAVALDLSLPDGARVEPVPGPDQTAGAAGGARIVDRNGKAFASVSPAAAWDADGRAVPVEMAVEGSQVRLAVAHRGADVRYPIAVDPQVVVGFGPAVGQDYAGWYSSQTPWSYFTNNCTPWWGAGLYSCNVHNQYLAHTSYANWQFQAPPSTFIYRADFGTNFAQAAPGMCITQGIWNLSSGWVTSGVWYRTTGVVNPASGSPPVVLCTSHYGDTRAQCVELYCSPVGWAGNQSLATYQLWAYGSGYRPQSIAHLATSVVYLGDSELPTVNPDPPPTGWLPENTPLSFWADASDAGVGVNVWTAGGGITLPSPGYIPLCGPGLYPYDRYGRCREWDERQFSVNTNQLPEGNAAPSVTATDVVGNAKTATWPVKVDKSPPALSVSGPLKDGENQRLGLESYKVDVSATDGSAQAPRSGVRRIDIMVDGAVQDPMPQDQACPAGSCPLSKSWTLKTIRFAAGEHTIKVVAYDHAGHSASQEWKVKIAHAASAEVGPGSVDLLSGNLAVSRTDVSVEAPLGDLTVARTYNSRDAFADPSGMFGPGWTGSVPSDASAAEYVRLDRFPDRAEIVLPDDSVLAFANPTTGSTLVSPPEAPDLTLTAVAGGDFELKDADGNVTRFGEPTQGSPAPDVPVRFQPVSTEQPGGKSTTFTYQLVPGSTQARRVTRVLAPVPANVDCSGGLVAGCRALTFVYSTATGGGEYQGRLRLIELTAADGNGTVTTNGIEQYSYDAQGRLVEARDLRTNLAETYAYSADGLLTTVDPPDTAPWTLSYVNIEGVDYPTGQTPAPAPVGRLRSATGPAFGGGQATSTVAYRVPVSGGGAPRQMGPGDVAAWGQAAADDRKPVAATAVFPPDSVPSFDASGSVTSSYARSTVHYLDDRGREVNTMAPGGRITAAEYDGKDQVTGTLTAANRERAVAAGDKRSLWTERTYGGLDGIDLLSETGPVRDVRLPGGSTQAARPQATYAYGGPPHLPTSTTTKVPGAGAGQDDARTTTTAYNATLRLPTEVHVDSTGLDLVTRTSYNGDGQVTERRLPKAGISGAHPAARQTIYWTAGANGQDAACGGRPEWAGMACKAGPTAQPASGTSLPVATLEYNRDLNVTTRTEKDAAGATLRTTTIDYDPVSGRRTSESVTAAAGTPLPQVTFAYDGAGRLASTTAGGRTVSRTYDAATGLPSTYTDADGVQSTTTYDINGRPAAVDDGKGQRTLSYDPVTGDLAQVSDPAGVFSAAYDADGRLVSQGYPGGIFAATTYDNAGRATEVKYTKSTSCSSACVWLSEDAAYSIHGQVRATTVARPGQADATRAYAYDGAGRLIEARDTPSGQACTIRSYTFDADSNRTSLSARTPAAGTACDPNATPNTASYTADEADRLAGLTYDALGRATQVPAGRAGGSILTAEYYASDLARSADQGGQKREWDLDPLRRVRAETSTGAQNSVRIQHYAGDGDSPAWTSDQADPLKWTRNIAGPDGSLAAIQDSQAGITLQLPSLHGDIAATASPDPNATGLASLLQSDEFGNPQGAPAARYQWLGAKQRQTPLASGVIQMGARLYLPAIGRFLQTDPVQGGSANDYDYCNADPINCTDLDGQAPGTYEVRDTYMDSAGRSIALRWGNKRSATGTSAISAASRR